MENPQPKVLDSEIGWVAGFFDGEGTVALTVRASAGKNASPKVQPMLKFSGTDVNGLNALTDILERAGIAHHVSWWQPKGFMRNGKSYKQAWSVDIAGLRRSYAFAKWITPYLHTKKQRAYVMLDYLQSRFSHDDPRTPITSEEWEWVMAMRELNTKGGKAQDFAKAVKLNAERPGASSAQLAANGLKGAQARWGIQD